jgi:hypothetical protein
MNPELRRNMWLELTPIRMAIMPIVLGLIFFLCHLVDAKSLRDNYDALVNTSRVIFFILTCLWGVKAVAAAVPDEIIDHTWDFQKMSPISAWSMTWGKFLGSASYSWFGAIICLFVFFLTSLSRFSFLEVGKISLYMLTVAFLVQSIAFVISIDGVSRASGASGKGLSIAASIVALPIAFFCFSPAWMNMFFDKPGVPSVLWYGSYYNFYWFLEISLALALFWCLMGAYRIMRVELQYQAAPWAWLGFLIYQMVYLGGFVPQELRKLDVSPSTMALFISFLLGSMWTYLTIISEPLQPVRYRKLFRSLRIGSLKHATTLIPRWFVTYALTVVVAIMLSFSASPEPLGTLKITLHGFVWSATLFILRDIMVFLYLNFQGFSPRRANSFGMVYLGVVYMLLPMIFAAMNMTGTLNFFTPFNDAGNIAAAILPPLIQVAIIGFVLWRHWSSNFAEE